MNDNHVKRKKINGYVVAIRQSIFSLKSSGSAKALPLLYCASELAQGYK